MPALGQQSLPLVEILDLQAIRFGVSDHGPVTVVVGDEVMEPVLLAFGNGGLWHVHSLFSESKRVADRV